MSGGTRLWIQISGIPHAQGLSKSLAPGLSTWALMGLWAGFRFVV